ncbi:sulfurtransferase TusA family protein [Desulfoscipio gibsoniae]|uniref:Putative redox protein, regulator of disulfide bond formation n=1 Tax=Desulfoscipio gibsoniae DSM 7213 TaxID=767817 RepID=R4KRU7_9FIRM|nr:sulfurtransferase TusA family protein [Desulfoscipio gibsoniae]AGL02326.1 putative redox protein, regulator of disulfide bond formation [Desulfoscipio gibsoniae DSM 7213]
MSTTVDARGLLCPEPVLLTKKAIDQLPGGSVEVIVDNPAAKENVTRLCENKGWNVMVKQQGLDYVLKFSK